MLDAEDFRIHCFHFQPNIVRFRESEVRWQWLGVGNARGDQTQSRGNVMRRDAEVAHEMSEILQPTTLLCRRLGDESVSTVCDQRHEIEEVLHDLDKFVICLSGKFPSK